MLVAVLKRARRVQPPVRGKIECMLRTRSHLGNFPIVMVSYLRNKANDWSGRLIRAVFLMVQQLATKNVVLGKAPTVRHTVRHQGNRMRPARCHGTHRQESGQEIDERWRNAAAIIVVIREGQAQATELIVAARHDLMTIAIAT
jgi:hypothetical protein